MRFYGFEYSKTKHGYGIKRYNKKTTGSIHYDRYKNLPLNCEYEFELFMELKGQFTKVTFLL